MKICIAIEKFDPAVGGAERYCWDLAHFFAQRGHRVDVICMRSASDENIKVNEENSQLKTPGAPGPVYVHLLHPMPFPQGLRHLSFALLHYLKAKKMQGYCHFCVGNTFFMDIYQPHGGLHRAWFLRETMRYPASIRPFTRFIKRLTLKDMVQRGMEWWIFRVTRPEVIAISQMVKDDMKAAFGYPLEKIHLITNGIDTSRYTALNKNNKKEIRERYGIAPDTFVFLFVANNLALKGFDLLLDACRMLGGDAFKVLVTGPASAEDKAMASDLGDIIVFGDRAKDLERIYPACDCLVHPTYYDACSLVVLEALSCDLPVITTSANGASMYINPENGCVVPPADAAALAEAMKKQMTDNRAIGGDRVSFKDHNRVFVEIEALLKR